MYVLSWVSTFTENPRSASKGIVENAETIFSGSEFTLKISCSSISPYPE